MLGRLLTPLKARFEVSPLPGVTFDRIEDDENASAENFARDVLIEVMRKSVESLKEAEDLATKIEVMGEIQRIMIEDACTKDVFRELDGYLLLVNVLAILNVYLDMEGHSITETEEGERLAFMLLAESLHCHPTNQTYFERHVGFESIRQAVEALVRDSRTIDQTYGFILSVSLNNFALSSLFKALRKANSTDIAEHKALLGTIVQPKLFAILITLLPPNDAFLHQAVYTLTDVLLGLNHRDQVLLNDIQLFQPLFERYLNSEGKTHNVLQKLLKRLLEGGVSLSDARSMFQHAVLDGRTLDANVIEIIRSCMKARWPSHFSLEGDSAFRIRDDNQKGLPSTGFTFMIWLWIERLPTSSSQTLFKVWSQSRTLFRIALRLDGVLELTSTGNNEMAVLEHAKISKSRWTHLTIVHHPHRASNPTIRIFVDGILRDSRNWAYPRIDSALQTITYEVGDSLVEKENKDPSMSWCIASAYLSSLPFLDDYPRLIQHLGPRYVGHFQTKELIKFLTYESATSLNIFLTNLTAQRSARQTQAMIFAATGLSPIMKSIKDGLDIPEGAFLFSFSPSCWEELEVGEEDLDYSKHLKNAVTCSFHTSRSRVDVLGDVVATTSEGLDLGLWKLGGSRIALRLIDLASTPHELSRTIGIFADSVRMCWQMSEDMESTGAFELLGHILRTKGQLVNITAFETLFEFFGLNFRAPDHSVVINSLAYRVIGLDFEIWASAKPEIQRLFFEHLSTLLKTSKYRNFNAKQRLGKLGIIRKILFALQTDWYGQDMVDHIIDALKCVAQACWSATDTIKPMVSYLASNLHEYSTQASSPRSIISRFDKAHPRARAERVLEALVSILFSASHFSKFIAALPFTRVCLLLLGDHPTPEIAVQVLTLIGLAVKTSPSFSRKFELISGWTFVRAVLPRAWNSDVHNVCFDLLYGRIGEPNSKQGTLTVSCPQIVPAILAALNFGLTSVVQETFDEETLSVENFVEALLEELMEQQSTSPSFRQLFKSKLTTGFLISAYAKFVEHGASVDANRRNYIRILEKMNHLVLSLTLDSLVDEHQKQEILDLYQASESLLNTNSSEIKVIHIKEQRKSSIDVQILGEKAYQKTATRIREWRKSIHESEQKRLRRTALDLREYRRNGEASEWRNSLHDDRGLWPIEMSLRKWALDETEGPCRVRKKLQRRYELAPEVVERDVSHMVTDTGGDAQSFVQIEAPPWAESYDLRSGDPDSEQQTLDEYSEDNLRRIRRDLHGGDVIEAVCTVTRIVGVDSSPGLLILGSNFLYMVDGLVENETGEVIDARDAPRNLFSVPGSQLELDGKHRAQSWSYDQISSFSKKTCLFRDVALELYFKDSRSLLIVFSTKRKRQDMIDKINHFIDVKSLAPARSPLMRRTPMLGKMSAKVLSSFRDELSTAQRKWQAREISNFAYLSILNQASGRTPGDATQYPVFPWVLADYSSDTLDLSKPATFRDLSLPMGALTEERREAARQRYTNLISVGEAPFHYGTHFSSSMIVCHFLIRLEPFTHMFKTLQGGDWDLPDRLFSDISRSYHSASQDLRGDVRELIPEFFTCPEFLQNIANLDFGVQQNNGERIHDVRLPPWAKNDPLLFIVEHRKALECDFVSEKLPEWIDLIWGYKQRDATSLNAFHPFSYEGSIDLDTIKDELEREATVGIIHNFGQTPRKLFESPHPRRLMQGPTTLPLGTQFGIEEDAHLLVQCSRPVSEIASPITSLAVDTVTERVIPCGSNILYVPQRPHEQIEWGFVDQSLKLKVDRKVVQVVEPISCSCGIFVDSGLFITGSTDTMLRLWRLSRKDGNTTISQTHMLRAHSANVVCITACRAWSIIVSGSEDGTAIVWDLNRAVYVNTIDHRDDSSSEENTTVHCVAVNDSTGYIASCSNKKLCLHTVNAHPIVIFDLTLAHPSDGRITSLAFHEREYSRVGILATGTNTGTIALRTWTTRGTPDGERAIWKFFTLRTLQCREGADGRIPKVTALQFVGESIFHGEDSGKVYMWDLPE